ncbi:MAG: hypothetical protein ABI333_29090 [bacterium]
MEIQLEQPLLVDQQAVLHTGRRGDSPARVWVIDPAGAGPAAVEAAQRDLAVLQGTQQPGLLSITCSGSLPDGQLWAALSPDLDRGLDQRLAEGGPLTLPQLRSLARSLCGALAALHQQGVVHGGVHPALVRYDADDADALEPQLTGAGWASLRLAWLARGSADPEVLRRVAPELSQARLAQPERQADIFAAGCLLYEAATGKAAFPGASAEEVVAALTQQRARPDIRDALGPAEERLNHVLRRCLDVTPAKRYPSVTALWRELAPALGGRADPLPVRHAGGSSASSSAAGPLVDSTPPGSDPGSGTSPSSPPPPLVVDEDQARRRRGSALLTVGITAGAAAIALATLLLARSAPPEDNARAQSNGPAPMKRHPAEPAPEVAPTPGPRPAGRVRAAPRPSAGVPRAVDVAPDSRQLLRLLARVGLNDREVIVSPQLNDQFERAERAIRTRDRAAIPAALAAFRRSTLPRRCPALLRAKRHYVINGIRWLGKRLDRRNRFRIERAMEDARLQGGPCVDHSRRLAPLVMETRDRMVRKYAKLWPPR